MLLCAFYSCLYFLITNIDFHIIDTSACDMEVGDGSGGDVITNTGCIGNKDPAHLPRGLSESSESIGCRLN